MSNGVSLKAVTPFSFLSGFETPVARDFSGGLFVSAKRGD
jgi:hypothetical protein